MSTPSPGGLRDWLVESLGFYRELGFFKSPKTDEQVADWIERVNLRERRRWRYGSLDNLQEGTGYFHDDLTLLRFDRRRALEFDFESPRTGGWGMYSYELRRLARISCNAFEPHEIEELALSQEMDADVLLTFRSSGVAREYVRDGGNPTGRLEASLDRPGAVRGSDIPAPCGRRSFPGSRRVFRTLTVEERERIAVARGLEFHALPPDPVPRWEWWWPTSHKPV